MLVKLADYDWDQTPTDTVMYLVNADYQMIRCVGSPDNEKVAFINPEYLRLWRQELVQVCVTRLVPTILHRKHQVRVVPRLARIRWRPHPLNLPNFLKRKLARPILIAHGWAGHTGYWRSGR